MKSIKAMPNYLKEIYHAIFNSISFYPVVISAFFLFLAFLVVNVGFSELRLFSNFDFVFLSKIDAEIASTITSTIIGGVFSLTVFSFSMVMVVLSQASSNFSPRLLPGLISDKKHQIILGFYTGTLIYTFVLLINLGSLSGQNKDLGFAALLAAIFGIVCVVLFVVFIHGISQAIQIGNIIKSIYKETDAQLNTLIDNQEPYEESEFPFETVNSTKSGFYRDFNSKLTKDLSSEKSVQIEILPYIDKYVWKGQPLFRISKDTKDDLKNTVLESFNLSVNKDDSKEYLVGMTKLMEVAVKAMSPGINDPGTAIDATTELAELLRKAFQVHSQVAVDVPVENVHLVQHNISPKELMRIVVQPVRYYARKDLSVLSVLTESLNSIKLEADISENAKEALAAELELLKEHIVASGHHENNAEYFNTLFGSN